jgi:predicted nucleic acid-binding Zn ribbon protein
MERIMKIEGIPPRPVSFCKECGSPYRPHREDQVFCSFTCRSTHHRLRAQRGTILYDIALNWRKNRNDDALKDIRQLVDEWIRDQDIRKGEHRIIRKTFEAHRGRLHPAQLKTRV